ncbi:myb_DNA-bind_5 domain-containing protein [Trichonephila clavipes]|nr:myb_DNA-bind_5 domain-containing protein [Trichonephila clavipes]
MAKKSSVLRQERRQTRGGEVPKEAELTDFEMRFLEEPILTLPLSTPFDSDSTDIEISINSIKNPSISTSALLIPPVTPSQNTDKITEYDSSSDPSNAVMDLNDLKPTPKIVRPLKETLAMFRKRAKTPTVPSAAARAAACIEEHRMKIKYMEMDEERKNEEHQLRMEQLSNNMKMDEERKNEEHKLRMELLRIKIAHAKEKMEAQKILVTALKGSPKIYLQNTE